MKIKKNINKRFKLFLLLNNVNEIYINNNGSLHYKYINGFNGNYCQWFDNGNLRVTGNFKNGFREGYWEGYFENGNKKGDCIWANGTLNGLNRYYSGDGSLYKEAIYKDSKKISEKILSVYKD